MLSTRVFTRTLLRPRLAFLHPRGPRQPVVTKGQKKNIHHKTEDDFGGPGGQELYPYASAIHR